MERFKLMNHYSVRGVLASLSSMTRLFCLKEQANSAQGRSLAKLLLVLLARRS